MQEFKKLAHAVWECKYHIVWYPKYRFKIMTGELRRSLREIIRQLCEWKKFEIVEGNVQVDHIHLVLSVHPKYSILCPSRPLGIAWPELVDLFLIVHV